MLAAMLGSELVPEDRNFSCFSGYLKIEREEFKVRLYGVKYEQSNLILKDAGIAVEPALERLLAGHQEMIKIRLAQSSSLSSFLNELKDIIKRAMCDNSIATSEFKSLPPPAYYTRLIEDIDTIGWQHVIEMSQDLRTIELQTQDTSGRKHTIRIICDATYPLQAPVCTVDAPEDFDLVWDPKKSTLQSILTQFEDFLMKFQEFWYILDDLDKKCCILEPQHPSRASGRRRLAIAKHVSIQIEVNPLQPRSICEINLFGNENTTMPLREKWSDKMFQWNEELTVRKNLQKILSITFPSPKTTKTEEFAIECGICYCYRLELLGGEKTIIPDRLCDNANCSRPFHEKCLFEWLKALPSARQSFNTVFGDCPYCRETIGAKFVF
jgi:E3 ubiquitin-protein ligase FANCL